jgi:anaerobic C4-dicarboxylate transporter DcuA
MPAALALGVSPVGAIAAFASVSALFVLPTYPTLLAAIEFDDTGSTRIGKYVFNHPFIIPGVLTITIAVILGFLIAPLVI